MPYQLNITEVFQYELQSMPVAVQKKLAKEGYQRLREKPDTLAPPFVKKLNGWKDLYRLRLHDHRAVYRVERDHEAVTLLVVGHRSTIYERLGHDENTDKPSIRIIASSGTHHLLERQPNPDEVDLARELAANEPLPTEPKGVVDARLPRAIDQELLDDLRLTAAERDALHRCSTEGELLDCDVSENAKLAVMNALWPRPIDQVVNSERRVVDSSETIRAVADGARPLISLLLDLDDSQLPLTRRFKVAGPKGPWIVKGGPGTGKSIVTLYCLRNLLQTNRTTLRYDAEPLRVLMTTYTRALAKTSTDLLEAIGIDPSTQEVDVVNIDRLGWKHASSAPWINEILYDPNDPKWRRLAADTIAKCRERDSHFKLGDDDFEFLHQEVDEVIVGNEIDSESKYLIFKRTGQGAQLGSVQRKQVWSFACRVFTELKAKRCCLPNHVFSEAGKSVVPEYDYVFIEEAQDLSPVALRMCMKLAKNQMNVLLTADKNQSIYNSGFSWNRVSDVLDFRGRSTILRRNYRTTHEIMKAIQPLLGQDESLDRDTADDEPVYHGDRPALRLTSSLEETVEVLKGWLTRTIVEERATAAHAAILCLGNNDCREIAGALPAGLKAKVMRRDEVDLASPGIKVMTMHTAKGLQFPVVAVVGLEEGRLPRSGMQEEEFYKWRRTFFVACTRAMRRLLVIGHRDRPSSFLEGFGRDRWDLG